MLTDHEPEQRRSIVYTRVSTEEQAESGLGLAAQEERCIAYIKARDYLHIATATDAGISGAIAPDDRPGLGAALERLDDGRANVLVTSDLSRLGRKTVDVLELTARARTNHWHLVMLDLALDTSSPTGEFALTVLAAVAQLERRQIAERTRLALEQLKARGVKLGRPVANNTLLAGQRALELRTERELTWRAIAEALSREGFLTADGHMSWHPMSAMRAAHAAAEKPHVVTVPASELTTSQ